MDCMRCLDCSCVLSELCASFMCIVWVLFVVDVYSLDSIDGSCVLSGWCE